MKSLERFRAKMQRSGGSIRRANTQSSRQLFENTFEDDPSFTFGIYRWVHGLNDYSKQTSVDIRLYKRTKSNAVGITINFQSHYDDPIIIGDILYDSNNGEYYLCTESFDIDGIHWQGKLSLCNWLLKWQNDKGDIFEYPCLDVNTTQYNSGETSNPKITIASSQHAIFLPCDENTVILDTPKRFYVDKNKVSPTSFIITQNDTTSSNYGEKGLVRITLLEYAGDTKKDRPDLGLCDYVDKESLKKDNTEQAVPNVTNSVINYDSIMIRSGGDIVKFIGTFYDEHGKELGGITPKWHIVCDFIESLNIEEGGNEIAIGIDDDDRIGKDFRLEFSDDSGNYKSHVIVTIGSLF